MNLLGDNYKTLIAIGAVGTVAVVFPLVVVTHIFASGGPDKSDPKYNDWIMSICGDKKFINSVFTIGYVKASIRRFFTDRKMLFSSQPVAEKGKVAPDAKLIDLNGNELSLLKDYIAKMPKGMPLVLNMGSYT